MKLSRRGRRLATAHAPPSGHVGLAQPRRALQLMRDVRRLLGARGQNPTQSLPFTIPPRYAPMSLVLLAILIGALLPVQAGVNAQLRLTLGHPLTTAFASFLVGTIALGLLLVVARTPLPAPRAAVHTPVWYWVGGLLGAIYICGVIVLAPRLGAATLIASVIAGQMLASIVLDQFGWVGFTQHSATPGRLLGVALVMVGVRLVQQ